MKNKYFKIILTILATIILGALGSGLWEVALKPLVNSFVNGIVNFANILFKSLKDSLYASVAKGYQEEPSIYTVLLMLIIFWVFIGTQVATYFKGTRSFFFRKIEREQNEIDDEINKIEKTGNVDMQKLEALRKRIHGTRDKVVSLGKFLSLFFILYISFLSAQYIIISYKNTAITNYNQGLMIIKPFISTDEYDNFNSKFAQIRSEEDYLTITNEMKLIATANKLTLPFK